MPINNENMEEKEVENIEENSTEENTLYLEDDETNSKEEQGNADEKKFTQEELDEQISKRVRRVEREAKRKAEKNEKELEDYKKLEKVLRKGLGIDENEDVFQKVNDFYVEQGIEIPDYKQMTNSKDFIRLGEYDAQDLINSADFDEVQDRANELADLKAKGKMSIREDAEFTKLESYLKEELRIKQFKDTDISEETINSKKFKEFVEKFNDSTPVSEIAEMYTKIYETKAQKPASTGSAKSNGVTKDGDFFTKEQVERMSKKEVKENYKKIRESMATWTE